ncbi:MAG: RNA-binding S4 domain-containing protein [Acidimicrobiaceae bacterium]|nr:RNA-binding S4 domain-containing protein [Acidimicrobiaceae bacterium]MBT5578823.1 RNA-binding S4 domain-containing protein [Acidimicrobiaceae bacterium]MBT5852190.1 RNA-binding S4 domain-containing protein [Acidimicrobiaceae bacterium]
MTVRVDKWLWSVRVFKTRTQSTTACAESRVLVNDVAAKPSTKIGPGDVVRTRRRERTYIYVVVETIEKRVSAQRAAECFEDRSPPPEPSDHLTMPVFAQRDRGAGRPTKRDRRQIDKLRGRRE